jgi:hypothetical protein
MKLKALALGKDGLSGDSAFYAYFFSVDGNETFDELRQKWLQTLDERTDSLFYEESDEEPVEFVLIEEKTADALEIKQTPCHPWCDCAFNKALKTIAHKLAVKTIRC